MPVKTFKNGVFADVNSVKTHSGSITQVRAFHGGLWKDIWQGDVLTPIPYSEGWYQLDIYPYGRDTNNPTIHNACSDEKMVLGGVEVIVVADVGWADTLTPTPVTLSVLEQHSQLFSQKFPPIPMYTVYAGERYTTNGEHYSTDTVYYPNGGEMYIQKYNLSYLNVTTPT